MTMPNKPYIPSDRIGETLERFEKYCEIYHERNCDKCKFNINQNKNKPCPNIKQRLVDMEDRVDGDMHDKLKEYKSIRKHKNLQVDKSVDK